MRRAGILARGATATALVVRRIGRERQRGVDGAEEQPRAMLAADQTGMLALPSQARSEEHTSELQSLMRTSYAVFCLKKKKQTSVDTHKENNSNHQQRRT